MKKSMLVKVLQVAKYLEENPDSYLREISRDLNLSTGSVHRALKILQDFIEVRSVNKEFGINLPKLPAFVRLKQGVTVEGLAKYFYKKKKLEEISKLTKT